MLLPKGKNNTALRTIPTFDTGNMSLFIFFLFDITLLDCNSPQATHLTSKGPSNVSSTKYLLRDRCTLGFVKSYVNILSSHRRGRHCCCWEMFVQLWSCTSQYHIHVPVAALLFGSSTFAEPGREVRVLPPKIKDLYIKKYIVTYGPHKAVAEVSNHNEPIGRKSGIQLVRKIRKSMDFTFSCFVLSWLTDKLTN